MSGLCGWFRFEAGPGAAEETLRGMLDALVRHDRGETARAFGERGAVAVRASDGPAAVHCGDGVVAAIVGDPDPDAGEESPEPVRRLVRGYAARGAGVFDRLRGPFAAALLDERNGRAVLAVDRVGGRLPLLYTVRNGAVVFASGAAAIRAFPGAAEEWDPQQIYHYLYFHTIPGPGTAFRDVRRLLPGTVLQVSRDDVRVGRYWAPAYREDRVSSVDALARELRAVVRSRVARAIGEGKTGCFLSGGTDSSTIAGLLSEIDPRQANTYSMGFQAEGYDEMRYARITARHFGTTHREFYVTPDDVVEAVPRLAEAYAEPFGNASAIPTYYCAKLAREDGVSRLLAGDGGDELFGGNERYATQQVFDYYGRLPRPLRERVLEPLLLGLPGVSRVPLLRKAQSYVRQANVPMPHRLQRYNFLERIGPESILCEDFLSRVDVEQPRRLMSEIYHSATAQSLLNRMLALDMRLTIADNDLPKVSRMCELAGVDVRYPLLDDDVIELASRVPPGLHLRRGRLRWFWKHAWRDFLPAEVLSKPKHGFGLPFGVWMRDRGRLRALALDSLQDLKRRKLVRPDFLDELLRRHETEHAVYYGVLVWVLMMLELWFRTHIDRAAVARQPA